VDAQKDIIQVVRDACGKKVLFLPHAIRQMSRVDRMITTPEVHMVIDNGVVIEDYPEDVRGHSCLVLGCGEDNRPVHVVCSPKEDYLAIITAYLPDGEQWEDNYKKRKKI